MSIGEWLTEGLHSFKPSQEFSFQALRHLAKKKKKGPLRRKRMGKENRNW